MPASTTAPTVCWLNGRVVPAAEARVRVDDSAFREGRGCYSTARWACGSARFEERHLARLVRDSERLGIGTLDPERARRAFRELGKEAFGSDEGVIRLQASRGSDGAVHLVGMPRALGPEPDRWRAISLDIPHDGGGHARGAKVSNRLLHALAGDQIAEAQVEEGLLFDEAGYLVEGTRSNLVAVAGNGSPSAPPEARGAVAGIALEIVAEILPELERNDLSRRALGEVDELIAMNSVRGAIPIVELDGRPVGSGKPGPWAARLRTLLEEAA